MNELLSKHGPEVQNILEHYPDEKRSAVMPLLYLAERDEGYVPEKALHDIAEILGLEATEVGTILGFYNFFYDRPEGRYHVYVCTDLPCALNGAEEFFEQLSQRLGLKAGETSADGLITLHESPCVAACHRSPVMTVQGDGQFTYYENLTLESALGVIDQLRQKAGQEEAAQ